MRKIYILLFVSSVSFAQVGINTTTPLEEVHVAGNNFNIRADGLNSPNNVNNLGTGLSSKVFVDGDGTLVLASSAQSVGILLDADNFFAAPASSEKVNSTGVGAGYDLVPNVINYVNPASGMRGHFELTKDAILEVNYALSYEKLKNTSGKRIDHGKAYVVQTGLVFKYSPVFSPLPGSYNLVRRNRDGNYVNTELICTSSAGGALCDTSVLAGEGPAIIDAMDGVNAQQLAGVVGLNGQFYSNSSTQRGEFDKYHTVGTDYVRLLKGHYIVNFVVFTRINDTGGSGNTPLYVGGANDELQIIAHYY